MRFDLTDLHLFVAVAEAGSLTQAARQMHMVPAAASTRIKHLEETFAVKLLVRHSAGVRLTPAGTTMLYHARRMLFQGNRLRDDLSEFARGLKGIVRIFSISIGVTEHLPQLLTKYLIRHPNVSVEIEERLSDEIIRALRELSADIGIIGGRFTTGELQVFPFVNERLVVLTPARHPLSQRDEVSFEEAIEHDFVGFNESNTLNLFLSRRAAAIGKSFKTRALVRGPYEVSVMVGGKVGISIMEESVGRRFAAAHRITVVPLSDAWALREMYICVRDLSALPKFAQALVNQLRHKGAQAG